MGDVAEQMAALMFITAIVITGVTVVGGIIYGISLLF